MIKTLTKHGNSYALIIDKAILELLNIGPDSPLEITTDGKTLTVSPATDPKRHKRFKSALKKVNRKYRRTLTTLAGLRAHREAILALAARHGATNVRVFGSVARDGAGPDSDVDLLVEFAADRSLLDQIALIQDLKELLGHRVDVVSDRGLNPRVRRRVLEEAVPL